jgi:hypothetical protein
VAPTRFANFPATQSEQVEDDGVVWNLPAAQLTQEVTPDIGEYFPAPQGVHVPPIGPAFPAVQFEYSHVLLGPMYVLKPAMRAFVSGTHDNAGLSDPKLCTRPGSRCNQSSLRMSPLKIVSVRWLSSLPDRSRDEILVPLKIVSGRWLSLLSDIMTRKTFVLPLKIVSGSWVKVLTLSQMVERLGSPWKIVSGRELNLLSSR